MPGSLRGFCGIDQYIGDPTMIGAGHGLALICGADARIFDAGVPVIATDPHPGNARPIAAYVKLGFEAFGSPQETEWGLILPLKDSW
ncbi:GNAT family N-acetyltransferase [Yoonia sp. GPGPB17]|uniref:hypothetical protein n=1 Tax=Yoonia sp. GPGPB17 TaxID=3026147 RepID=UPI0030BA3051